MRFTFVHAADLHLDTPFTGLAEVNPAIAQDLRDASLAAWDDLVSWITDSGAAFALLAGDIYDGSERGLRAQLRFVAGLRRLGDAGVQTLIVHGNHDPIGGWSAIRQWPDGVTVFPSTLTSVSVQRDGVTLATVHGQSYAQAAEPDNLARHFRRGKGEGLQIGLLHASVEGEGAEHGRYAPCALSDLLEAKLDYWALGHVHARKILHTAPHVVYPGNLQGRSMAPGELGEKGAFLVEAEVTRGRGRILELSFRALDRVRMQLVVCPIDGVDDMASVRRELGLRSEAAASDLGGRRLVARGILEGRGPVHRDLARPGALSELLRDLRDGAPPGIWWEGLADATTEDYDRQARRQREDFGAEVIAESDRLLGDPAALTALWTAVAAEVPPPGVGPEGAVPDPAEELAKAERRCLDELDAEAPDRLG